MNKYKFILGALMSSNIFLASCAKQSNKERNKIVFNDPAPAIEDAIRKMEGLLEKLPDTSIKNYMAYQDKLTINSMILGKLDEIKANQALDTIYAFHNFSQQEIREFLDLAIFLKGNYIESSSKEPQVEKFLFNYRKTESNEYNDLRRIMLIENRRDSLNEGFKSSQQVLDREGNLVLVAPKDAIINN